VKAMRLDNRPVPITGKGQVWSRGADLLPWCWQCGCCGTAGVCATVEIARNAWERHLRFWRSEAAS
jgi:hypothetical protein